MQKPHLAFKNGVILLPVHISGLQIIYQDLSYSVFLIIVLEQKGRDGKI